MKNLKKRTFLALLLLVFNFSFCISQTTAPKIAMPSQQNKIIIDKIIKATSYNKYVVDFCLATINEAVLTEKWNDQKTAEVTESIHFKHFKDAVYNMFAFYNEIELETLLKTYQENNAYQTSNVMISNDALAYNLEIFANDIVRQKYK